MAESIEHGLAGRIAALERVLGLVVDHLLSIAETPDPSILALVDAVAPDRKGVIATTPVDPGTLPQPPS